MKNSSDQKKKQCNAAVRKVCAFYITFFSALLVSDDYNDLVSVVPSCYFRAEPFF